MTLAVPDEEDTGLAAVAAERSGVVAVGARRGRPVAWFSRDGVRWVAASGLSEASPAEMTSVVAFRGGFVAAGGAGPAFGRGHAAAFWISDDGRSWRRLPDDPAFTRGHVWGLAAVRGRLVAVGTGDDPQNGPAASWTSRDGEHWRRAPAAEALADGVMLAVAASRGQIVAVGRSGDGARAAAWRSRDGLHWSEAPDSPEFASDLPYAAHAEMNGIARMGRELVAVGWVSSTANGTGVAWSSTDGLSWRRLPPAPSLPGGGMAAVTVLYGRIVAVGSTGWPDTHAADAWVR